MDRVSGKGKKTQLEKSGLEGPPEKQTLEERPEEDKRASHKNIRKNGIWGRGKETKGLGVRVCLEFSSNREEVGTLQEAEPGLGESRR